jgi:AcrR family transcriptional regulator
MSVPIERVPSGPSRRSTGKPGGPGRRRRSYLPADQRRAQILACAKSVFAQRGYHAASVSHLCAAARIGRGTLYQYFPNKRAVMLALLEGVEGRVRDVMAARQPLPEAELTRNGAESPAVLQFCERRLRELLDAIFVDEATLRLVVREARNLDGVIGKVIDNIDTLILGALEHDLMVAQRARILRLGDPTMFARYVLGGIEKVILMALLKNERLDLAATVHQCVQLELFGLFDQERNP